MRNLSSVFPGNQTQALPIVSQKQILRDELLAQRSEIHKYSDPDNWGPRQFRRALELLEIHNVNDLRDRFVVGCYFPIRHELDLTPFAEKHWLFPKMGAEQKLTWFEYGDGKTDYTVNRFGIKEKPDQYCIEYNEKSLPMICFVPGLAGSQNGDRLGYGGGYYDKFLKEFGEKVTSILCLPSQHFLFNTLPVDAQDAKVDLLVF